MSEAGAPKSSAASSAAFPSNTASLLLRCDTETQSEEAGDQIAQRAEVIEEERWTSHGKVR
eukprot:CAMPEP_0194517220 /NCGR_PEP_ID=MMETSP0253-20130528/50333_1 /TAXON_ID=2966 /ORGANISM="Noctiluca scintillans" /LENGTH=60 /DNA_ID=CAMNT_0039361159 /DNA_START=52 /DNA_END=230 /DNA_ORIENTATION=-